MLEVTELPAEGERFLDGMSPGYSWRVESDEGPTLGMRLYQGHSKTETRLDWPKGRWRAFVERQDLREAS